MAMDSDAQPSVLGIGLPADYGARVTLPDQDDTGQQSSGPVRRRSSTESVDVESFFQAFHSDIASQVSEDDSRMHYDIGLACLEMGQMSIAIEAFRRASKDPSLACVSLSMIASAWRSAGRLDDALDALHEAASVRQKSRAEETGVHYELAVLYEIRGERMLAIHHLEHVLFLAPDFRDARVRYEALRQGTMSEDSNVTDQEIDRVLDDLFMIDP